MSLTLASQREHGRVSMVDEQGATMPSPGRTRRLDHLPIVAQALKRLRVAEIVDSVVAVDPRSHVTTGQCVEALVLTIVMGSHTLYRVDDLLRPFDLEVAMGWSDPENQDLPSRFNDERIGNALDALFNCEGGLPVVNTALTMESVKAYELALTFLHFDSSSIRTFGAYAASQEPEDPDAPNAVPHITYGFSKDHRPDLKQILFGLTVTGDGAVPIHGRAASGNRADALEARFTLDQLAALLPDPSGSTLVGDSKFFAGETLLRARRHRFHYVTLMPETVTIWNQAYAALVVARRAGPLPVLMDKEAEHLDGTSERWSGVSLTLVYEYEDEDKVLHRIPLRALAVESTALRSRKLATLTRQREKERAALEKLSRKLRGRSLHCGEDAEAAANDALKAKPPKFHLVAVRLVMTNRPVKRARRGRPRADEPQEVETVWSSSLEIEEDAAAFEALLARESCFVLATDRPSAGTDALSDTELLASYKAQFKVEGRFKSAKGPLEVAPVFLKTPRRLSALTLVYVIALMVYTLIQRETRLRLAATQTKIPGNIGWTDQPTTEVVFRLMEGIFTVRSGTPGSAVSVTNMTTPQAQLLKLLGSDLLHRPSVHIEAPTPPQRGQRGYEVLPQRGVSNS
jgi:transposase